MTIVERGTIRKRWRGRLPIALVFPNTYRVGMANLGFLALYQFLNRYEEIVCERFFWSHDLSRLRSVETNRPLRDFKLVLVSVPFEGDFPKILSILKAGGLSLNPAEREVPVIAGGVAIWLNPVPLFPFLDGFLIGELEALGEPLVRALLSGTPEKHSLLERLFEVPGFLSPNGPFPVKIVKSPKPKSPLFSTVITPEAEFGECQLIEVTRGCGQACRFCAAGYLYRPPRRFEYHELLAVMDELYPGVKVGLIGLEFLKYQEIEELAQKLLEKGHPVSFSSLRVDALKPDLSPLFESTRTVTLAIEAASERLRRIINKRLTRETILSMAEMLATWKVTNLKLYFMFGLPFEEPDDLSQIPELVAEIKKISKKRITVSLSPFVPKPWTPFQWASFEPPEKLKEKARTLRKALGALKVKVSTESVKEALVQALIARGDETLKNFLLSLAQGYGLSKALKTLEKPLSEYLRRKEDQGLPWEVVDPGIQKEFLWREWIRAREGQESLPCRPSKTCRLCGACLIFDGPF